MRRAPLVFRVCTLAVVTAAACGWVADVANDRRWAARSEPLPMIGTVNGRPPFFFNGRRLPYFPADVTTVDPYSVFLGQAPIAVAVLGVGVVVAAPRRGRRRRARLRDDP